MTLTDKDLGEMQKRVEAATSGPWADEDSDYVVTTVEQDDPNNPFPVVSCGSHLCLGENRNPKDNEFIAHSRTDVPSLVAEVRRLRKIVAYAKRGFHLVRLQHCREFPEKVLACCEEALVEIERMEKE